MATAKDLIEQAYIDIGVVGRGKAMSAYLAQIGLKTLNQMLGMFSTEHFLIPSRSLDIYPIVSSSNQYTIGPGGDIDVVRPEEVIDAYIRIGGIDYPLEIFTMEEFNDIGYKSQGYIPTQLWYEPSYPLGIMYLDTQPGIGHVLYISSYKPITEYPLLTTETSFPAGYELVIRANLSLLLAPANGKTPSQITYKTAHDGLIKIKRVRAAQRAPVSKTPRQLNGRSRYNFISDGYR